MKKYSFQNAILGFTLAEVLITLGIIGIVAEITIPTLYSSFMDQNYKVAYKKAYSVASQAWGNAVGNNQIEPRTSWSDFQTKIDNFNAFKSYFKIVKECDSTNQSECWDSSGDKYSGYPASDALMFVDSSGMAWSITGYSTGGATFFVDTNGLKKPNKLGQDRFVFLPVTADSGSSFDTSKTGLPIRIGMPADYTAQDNNCCPSGNTHPCYYKAWLYN